jgi:hypothetical protein
MASNKFVFEGLEELKAALRTLPADLTAEASRIVEGEATGAAVTLRTIYGAHNISGDLQDKVQVRPRTAGQFGVAWLVVNGSRIAWLFDNGSQARHYVTSRGNVHQTGKMWGKTPPTHAFVKTMVKARRVMYEKLADLMRRHGLTVTGQTA